MFKASTNIGKLFSDECIKLNAYFVNNSRKRITNSTDIELSNSVELFFTSINNFPKSIAESEYSLTELFEIDQAIMGSYGASLFVEEPDLPMKKLLRDIIALWFRYELLGYLERKDSTYFDVAGVRSFYDSWILSERVGVEVTEYERIIANVAMLLENNENLENSSRLLLFNVLGDILVTLGVNDEDAEKSLQKYIYDINDRQNPSLIAYAEILLNLYVLNNLKIDLKRMRFVNYNELIKAIRFWSSKDEFSEKLFKSWEIYWENDYFNELNEEEIRTLELNKHSLYSYYNKPNLNIGHSFIEYTEHKAQYSGLMSIYKPASIFIFGGAGVGKSSFLTAFSYDAQMHVSRNDEYNNAITLGKDLQAFYQENTDSWHNQSLKPTSSNNEFTFWEDLNLLGYTISDYAGKDVRPDQWDTNLQNLFQKSRALIFFIDEKDYTDAGNLRRKSALFNLFLEYWMASNPGIRHIPIAVVLSKYDLMIPDLPSSLQRSTLIPHNVVPAAIDEYFDNRFQSKQMNLKNNPYERFCDLVLNDKANNSNPALQDTIANLLENFAPFFQRMLDLTYNYQIFLTSSLPPEFNGDTKYPYGVKAPMSWISSSLEKIYVKETLTIYENEEETIRNSINEMNEEVLKMYKLNKSYEDLEFEYNELAATRNPMKLLLFAAKKEDMNKQMKNFEDQLKKICQKYGFELDKHNRKLTIQKIEAQTKEKESTSIALEDKKRQLINKKRYN